LKTSDFDYDLPADYIAQHPVEPRDTSRLLVLHRDTGLLEHVRFFQIGKYLRPGDVLVINQTRVIPARLFARKQPGGGKVELLLLRRVDEKTWEILVGGKSLNTGRVVDVEDGPRATIVAVLSGSRRLVQFDEAIENHLRQVGHVPLPPYITARLENPERYQTVFAREEGSAAAPTAGLHFTPELLSSLQKAGVKIAPLTLHIGLDTFAPVTEENPEEHKIHTEWCQLSAETAHIINAAYQSGGRILAVGTTSVRTLETAAQYAGSGEVVGAFSGPTDIFILPGYSFKVVDGLVTNFHLPKSTLLMMVSAFAGKEQILAAYETAKQMKYRFYSFGDAMLIL
jgi:S-adenosylmethionine:tRNA ribosyltransferase-isomerase